jgi:drug/metabolite transporter (DMT)-like permease
LTSGSRRDAITLYTLIGAMVFFWSGNYIAAKIALSKMPPLFVTSARISLAGIAILPVYWFQQRKRSTRDLWEWREAPGLFLLGVLGVTLNQLLFVLGIAYTSVAHAGIIIALTPMCVLLLAALMGLERLTRESVIGMLIALAGVAVLQVYRGGNGSAKPTPLGDAIVFLGAVTFSLFTVFNKRIAHRRTGTTVNTFAYTGGALLLLPLTAFEWFHHDPSQVTFRAWAAVLYMALFPSVVAYLIYSWALKRVAASQLAAFSYVQPLLATLMAAAILKETVTPALFWSGLLILGGVMITERARSTNTEAVMEVEVR